MSTRQLAAIMFTDMVGYTALMQQNEPLALQQRNTSKKILDGALEKYGGRLLQHYGDGTLSIFGSALNAVKSATEIQTQNLQNSLDMRIGVHSGDVMFDETGIYGDSVNVASRLESLAVPGSVFISEKLFNEISSQGIEAKPLGYFELKNVQQPMQVYAVTNPGVVIPSRDEVRGKLKQTLNTIAVLPFASMSADPENEYFCDGLAEELINVLSKVEGLQVTSRTSSFAFKGKSEDVRAIAGQLNVQKIIEGSVRKGGNKVRITVQLINAADGYHFWSETYDRDLENIFEVQDDISRTIANKLRSNLSVSDHEKHLVNAPTENIEAYKKYLQGLQYWNKPSIREIMQALQFFNEAVILAPNFANPYAHIAYIHVFYANAGIIRVSEAAEICKKAAAKAIQIDPMNAWSQLAAGINAFYFEWDMPKTERCLEKAIELNPNFATAYVILGWYRMVMQQRDRIDEPLQIAYRLDPMGGETVASAGEVSFLAGDLDKAEMYCNEALSNDPENMHATSFKSLVLGFKGDWNAAIDCIEPATRRAPEFNLLKTTLGIAYAKSGQSKKTEEIIAMIEEKQKPEDSPPLNHLLALLYLSIGNKEMFYYNYELSVKNRIVSGLHYYNSPFLAEVSGEERIKKLRIDNGFPI